MTRKLENLDFATLDRAAGGCRPVGPNAQSAGPAFKMANKLGALVDHSGLMNVTTLPASFADIHEALPAIAAEIHEALPVTHDLPPVEDLIPTSHDLFANVGADDLPQVLDSTQLGSGLDDLPINWCGTADQNQDAWDDTDSLDANSAGADLDVADHSMHVSDFGSVLGHAVEEPIAAPVMRDHRMASIVEADRLANAVVHDHREEGGAAATSSQPTIRDQR